jgi:hypothetical protein
MNDLKFAARMVAAFIALALVYGIALKWDEADSQRDRVAMMNRT